MATLLKERALQESTNMHKKKKKKNKNKNKNKDRLQEVLLNLNLKLEEKNRHIQALKSQILKAQEEKKKEEEWHKKEIKVKEEEARLKRNEEILIEGLQVDIEALEDEKSSLKEVNKQLTYRERELNDELQEAFKEALQIMKACNCDGGKGGIGIKRMGEMNTESWKEACKRIFKENWELKFATQVSIWEEKLSDSSWYPFKVIPCGDSKWEKQLNTEDEDIVKLSREYGHAVLESVVKALTELDDYNSSGRYPVSLIWNFTAERKATMKEILLYLISLSTSSNKRIKIL